MARWAHMAGPIGILFAALAGCQTAPSLATSSHAGSTKAIDDDAPVRLLYATASDRLVVGQGAVQPASYTPSSATQTTLPAMTTATVRVIYPHPAGRAGHAEVAVWFRPQHDAPAMAPGGLGRLVSNTEQHVAQVQSCNGAVEAWTLDMPKWQLDALVADLNKQQFFRTSRTFTADAFLAASVGEQKAGKNCKAIVALDALALRARSEGRPLPVDSHFSRPFSPIAAPPALQITRLPPVEAPFSPPISPYQTAAF